MKMRVFVQALFLTLTLAGCHASVDSSIMILDVCGTKQISSPSPEQIRESVLSLDASGDAYLILGSSQMTYIQCSGDQKKGFVLEYQEETIEQHYRTKRNDLDAELIIAKFSEYAAGDDSWKDDLIWEKITW